MSIQPVGPTGVGGLGGADPSCFVSPDALMAYCESRMANLDTQMKTAFAQQQKTNADSVALTDLAGSIANCSQGGIAKTDPPNNHAGSDLVRAFQVAINKVGPDTELGKKLIAEQKSFADAVGGAVPGRLADNSIWSDPPGGGKLDDSGVNTVSPQSIQDYVAHIKTMQSDLNGGAELSMINLQAIMSQRQTAIQLTTNLVQSLGDQMNKIAANIGH